MNSKMGSSSLLTNSTASLAAMIRISAQETTLGHASSSSSLASSITWYDLRELMLESASFSPNMLGVSSSNSEASQP